MSVFVDTTLFLTYLYVSAFILFDVFDNCTWYHVMYTGAAHNKPSNCDPNYRADGMAAGLPGLGAVPPTVILLTRATVVMTCGE